MANRVAHRVYALPARSDAGSGRLPEAIPKTPPLSIVQAQAILRLSRALILIYRNHLFLEGLKNRASYRYL